MSAEAANTSGGESVEIKEDAPVVDSATTTPADTVNTDTDAAVTEPPVEDAETAEKTPQVTPVGDDTEKQDKEEDKPAEESMEVEVRSPLSGSLSLSKCAPLQESKPEIGEVEKTESNNAENNVPNATASSTSQEPIETETSVASTTETKPVEPVGCDSSVPSNDVKVKNEPKDKRQKVDLSKAPVRQYLDATVVPVLLGALSALARERPANPVEYLGNYLLDKSKEFATD